jgi:DNA-binding LytR/AlgR family response regulator
MFVILTFTGLAHGARSFTGRERIVAAAAAASPASIASVRVKTAGRQIEVALSDVDWIETQGNYLALHTGTAVHLLRETSLRFEAKLDPAAFVRVHRRTLVALDRVLEINPLGNGDASLVLRGGVSLRVSRSYRDKLREALRR